MRANLKKARQDLGKTQQAMADELNIGLRHYQRIESGTVLGSIEIWDVLEDLTQIHQRQLREIQENHHDLKANR